jgi:hypothetical protein
MREPEIVCSGTSTGLAAVALSRYPMAPAAGEIALNPAVEMSVS